MTNKIKVIIGFSRTRLGGLAGLFSFLIRSFERTKYSHVFVAWENTAGRKMVYQASGIAVNFMTWETFGRHAVVFDEYALQLDADRYGDFVNFMMANAGENYGIKQAVGIGLVRLARWWLGIKIKKNPSTEGQICSEVVAGVLDFMGIKHSFDVNMVGPRDIHNFLESRK